ncbi:hypothetical protein HK098_004379 [Nowakowskiella sp. JEL0407]|nr:hypothetical protein HK098_004379 [Nowakowskiella sp. JEL0407]
MGQLSVDNRRTILGSIILVLLILLPIWWKTTEVYRAALPLSRIESSEKNLDTIFTINILLSTLPGTCIDGCSDDFVSNLQSSLNQLYKSAQNDFLKSKANELVDTSPNVLVQFKLRSKINDSDHIRLMQTLNEDVEKVEVLEEAMFASRHQHESAYNVVISCSQQIERKKSTVYLGSNRILLISLYDSCQQDRIVSKATRIIAGLFAEEQLDYFRLKQQKTNLEASVDLENMRTIKHSNEYQLSFNLFNADPRELLISWDTRVLDAYINPFLERLNLFNFTVSSQVQQFASLGIQPVLKTDKSGALFNSISLSMLPQFINSAEWNFASAVSSAPPLNFVLYIPTKHWPLKILKSSGEPLETNSFLIHRWGGVSILNLNITDSSYVLPEEDLHPVMEKFIGQLRNLLDIKPVLLQNASKLNVNIHYSQASQGLTLWELDRLTRMRTIRCLIDASGTLNSLSALVTKMENMVILDTINEKVTNSLDFMSMSKISLEQNQLRDAYLNASKAIDFAESAFFDPTMVAMLYFPDEHKFAVYLPLFFPLSVPVILAIFQEIKYMRQKQSV